MSDRPFLSLNINQLQELSEKNFSDTGCLREVVKELRFRKTSAARQLKQTLEQRLNSLVDQSTDQKMNTTPEDIKSQQVADASDSYNNEVDPFVLESLELMRKKLLDLTARNRLLNFKIGQKTSGLRIIDEVPNQLAEQLLSDKELKFRAVPSPTRAELIEHGYLEVDKETDEERNLKPAPKANEWAKVLGLNVDFELPREDESSGDRKHRDSDVQVLLFSSEMESQLRTIRSTAQTAIEESGASILYLTFGFLEWIEREDSDEPRLAPLFSIPVHLNRGRLDKESGTYQYTISYTGEDIFPNLSLREKLNSDFALALPDFEEDETPDGYLDKVASLIEKRQPNWSVRRFGALTLLNFSKMLMYLDLDPSRWPQDQRNLVQHPIVQRFFKSSGDTTATASGSAEEYRIDDLDQIHQLFPLIDDADSSQHSALIDAVNGKNLVIEGPPGTGKSQTITNLIAAAMLNGKKVLFVAEKMAALEVVKRRLDRAGLGDFCLELHSHKSQKRKVLEELDARVKKRVSSPARIDADIQLYEEKKEQLNLYAREINECWRKTGLSIHDIFSGASRYRQQLTISPKELHIEGLTGKSLTEIDRLKLVDQVDAFQKIYRAMLEQLGADQNLTDHPWSGVENTEIQLFDAESVVNELIRWQDSLSSLRAQIQVVSDTLNCAETAIFTFQGCRLLIDDAQKLPELSGKEVYTALVQLDNITLNNAKAQLARYEAIQNSYKELSDDLVLDSLVEFSQSLAVPQLPDLQKKTGSVRDTRLKDIIRCITTLAKVEQELQPLVNQLSEVREALPKTIGDHLGFNQKGLEAACELFEVVDSLDSGLISSRSELFENDELDPVLDELDQKLEILIELRSSVSDQLRVTDLPDESHLKAFLTQTKRSGVGKFFSGDWWQARKQIKSLAVSSDGRIDNAEHVLNDAISYVQGMHELDVARYKRVLGDHFSGLDTDVSGLKTLRSWVVKVRQVYGIGFGKKAAIGDAILSLETRIFKGIKQLESQGLSEKIKTLLSKFNDVNSLCPSMPEGLTIDSDLLGNSGLLSVKRGALTESLHPVQSWIRNDTLSIADIEHKLEKLAQLAELQRDFSANDVLTGLFSEQGKLAVGHSVNNSANLSSIQATLELATHIHEQIDSESLRKALLAVKSEDDVSQIRECLNTLTQSWQNQLKDLESFSEYVNLIEEQWLDCTDWGIDALLDRNQAAIDKPEWLNDWLNFVRIRDDMNAKGLEPLWIKIIKGELNIEQAKTALDMAIFDQLAREVLQEKPYLSRISGKSQKALQETFCEYDHKLKQLQRDRIASVLLERRVPTGYSGGRKSEYTEMALIKNELGKKTRHIPIRQLVNRASNALIALKPCFMMGPMSAAQYLRPGHLQFDLIVMDEASQIKPEDALGVIARGKQLVVVGDPKQLPPTSFFDRRDSGDDEEDSAAVADTGSILDASLPLFEMRRLRWHYRSQHESLIAFSNRNFYDNDLVIFPSPHAQSPDFGVKFTYVRDARFVNQRNTQEARIISNAIVEHALNRPSESLGVVAMSAKQREQIEGSLDELCKRNPLASEAVDRLRNGDDGLFIKNLENVQGDERDVIFISCTYGPGEVGGRVYQRFGPINSDVGWRRLNVLFTRSKKRMHVFSSMRAEDILLSETSKRGVIALRNFLHFAEKGNMDGSPVHTGKAPDSDFEVAVIEALYQAGFECEAQVGVAGFFVDIAVKDPGNPGRYLIAIECDGATYHSAKSARDRDRLRQEILERLGWEIHRIWSTDWFANPKGELDPIIRRLHQLKSEPDDVSLEDMDSQIPNASTELNKDATVDAEEKSCTVPSVTLTLREKLESLAKSITTEFPGTPKEQRLLRPAMIEALVEHEPFSPTEFVELIPEYLRKSTAANEAKTYLDKVLHIIADYEVEEEV